MRAEAEEAIRIVEITGADLRHEAGGWAFAEAERQRIAAHYRALKAAKPETWNGSMLMGFAPAIAGGRLAVSFRSTDFASFVAWRDWGFADPQAWNCFGSPLMQSCDGALIYGVMGAHTVNAGLAYPPSGSLEARDIGAGGVIDIERSMRTEVEEETGLDLDAAERGAMWAVFEAQRLSVARLFRFAATAAEMVARIEAFMAGQRQPELQGVLAIRQAGDLEHPMPP